MCLFTILATAIYAIVGGPAVGKTSIINELSLQGETIVREAATDYVLEQLDKGVKEPWNRSDFQLNVLKLHLAREAEALTKVEAKKTGRIFSDRGLLDHFVYSEHRRQLDTKEFQEVKTILNNYDFKTYYRAVFYVHPFNDKDYSAIKTDARHEDTDESRILTKATYAMYKKHIPHLIEVPPQMTPKERAAFILDKIKEIENSEARI